VNVINLTQCGDSICEFTSGVISVKYKNSSNCVDNKNGEDISLKVGSFDCTVTYISTINCSLCCVQSATHANGIRKDSFSNAVNCETKYLVWHDRCSFSFENCCFFRISKTNCYGSPTFTNCIGASKLAE